MFGSSCPIDEIRRVYRECDYDIDCAISELLERQKQIYDEDEIDTVADSDHRSNLDKIMERYGNFLDVEIVKSILNENENDYEMTCVVIQQLYQLPDEDVVSQVCQKSSKAGESHRNELIEKYQNRVDLAVIHAIFDECNEDWELAAAQLETLLPDDTPQSFSNSHLDAATLLFLIRSSLLDILPLYAVEQFMTRNSVNETLPLIRLEFVLNQILLVIATLTSLDDIVDAQGSEQDDDILEAILLQYDSDLIPVDWKFESSNYRELSLLELLSSESPMSEPSCSQESSPLETIRQFLNGAVGASTENILADGIILDALDANGNDVDSTLATLSRTVEQLLEGKPETLSQITRSKKNSGPRTIGTPPFNLSDLLPVSYASVLRSESVPEIPLQSPTESQSVESAPARPWKPSIVVVPLESSLQSQHGPQMAQFHLEQEQYWRSVQNEQRKNISRLITARSRDGLRSVSSMSHEASRASVEASKHAILARNPGLLVGVENNSLHFHGFNDHHKISGFSPSSRSPLEFSVDLHGVDVLSAVQFVSSLLDYLRRTVTLDHRKCIVHVIVGRGSHSQGGVARLKPSLRSFLLRKGYRVSVSEAEIIVHLGQG